MDLDDFGNAIAVSGDLVECLAPLRRRHVDVDGRGSPLHADVRAVILAVDAKSSRHWGVLKKTLCRRISTLLEADSLPAITQVIIVVDQSPLTRSRLLSGGERLARSVHVRLAQDWGLDTAVTVVATDAGTSASLLTARISELARRPPGLAPAAALTAEVLTQQTLTQAMAQETL